jgi:GH15 family glucan-1,4-alpha-glucosidase
MSKVPIAAHAFVSDCHSAALVTADGSVDWLCFPRFDSPSVFGRLLDEEAGHWSIRPAGEYSGTRRYADRTLVLRTTFRTPTGTVTVTDALALDPGDQGHALGRRVPHLLIRSVAGVAGTTELAFGYRPRPEYGLLRPLLSHVDGGVTARGGAEWLVLTSPVRLELAGSAATARFTVRAGETVRFALHRSTLEERPARIWSQDELAHHLAGTVTAWRSWSDLHQNYAGPWRDLVHHSGRVLQGLTFRPSGAIVAAATTSLPEEVGGERNWDYRYAWVRDASLTMEALWVAACPDEASDFFAFMTTAAAGAVGPDTPLQIMFGVGGEHDLTERTLPHLAGWRDSRPVRVGNGAWNQEQIDVYGELLGAAHRLVDQDVVPDEDVRAFLVALADSAAHRWREPDQGIWEVRGPPRHFVYSKVMCWVALDRGDHAGRPAAGRRPGGRLDRHPGRDPADRAAGRLERDRRGVHAVLRVGDPGRGEPDAGDRRVPAGRGPADAGHHRGDRGAADRRARPGLPVPRRGGRGRAGRHGGDLPAVHVLAGAGLGAGRAPGPGRGGVHPRRRLPQRRRAARRGGRSGHR